MPTIQYSKASENANIDQVKEVLQIRVIFAPKLLHNILKFDLKK